MKQSTMVTTLKTPSGTYTLKSETINHDSEFTVEVVVAAGATEEVDIVLPKAKIEAFGMTLAKAPSGTAVGLAATVKTNSTSAPGNTFTLSGTNGLGWSKGESNVTNPVTVDITKFYIVNASAQDVLFKATFAYNADPATVY